VRLAAETRGELNKYKRYAAALQQMEKKLCFFFCSEKGGRGKEGEERRREREREEGRGEEDSCLVFFKVIACGNAGAPPVCVPAHSRLPGGGIG
jgi:hypothetical protein